ncbi:MAG: hypothetical protein R3A44_38155 [Caldilineaceae bacterium]
MYGGRHMGPLAILFLAVAFLTQQLLDIAAAARRLSNWAAASSIACWAAT